MDLQGRKQEKTLKQGRGGGRQIGASEQSTLGTVLLDIDVVRGSVLVLDDEVEQLRLRESLESGVRGESLRLSGLDDSDGDVGTERKKQTSQHNTRQERAEMTGKGDARDLSNSLDSGVEEIVGLLLFVERACEGEGGLQSEVGTRASVGI